MEITIIWEKLTTEDRIEKIGESINLVNNYKVDNVIFNSNDYNDLELELIKVLDDKNSRNI